MKPRMTFLTLLLFFELTLAVTAGMLGGGIAARLGMVAALGLPPLLLLRAPAGTPPITLAVRDRRTWLSLLLLPLFILITAGTSLLWGFVADLLGLALSGAVPMESFLLALLFDAALPAVLEELFCRGALFSVLRPMGRRVAVLGSALLFSLMHASLAQLPYALVAGILLALVYELTGSLLFPILFHFANNLVSLLLLRGLSSVLTFALLGGAAVLGLLLLFLLLRRDPPRLPEREARPYSGFRELFLSPVSLYIAVILTMTLA